MNLKKYLFLLLIFSFFLFFLGASTKTKSADFTERLEKTFSFVAYRFSEIKDGTTIVDPGFYDANLNLSLQELGFVQSGDIIQLEFSVYNKKEFLQKGIFNPPERFINFYINDFINGTLKPVKFENLKTNISYSKINSWTTGWKIKRNKRKFFIEIKLTPQDIKNITSKRLFIHGYGIKLNSLKTNSKKLTQEEIFSYFDNTLNFKIPVISISTKSGNSIETKNYENSFVKIHSINNDYNLDEEAKVKLRGNASFLLPNQSYKIKLNSKQNLLGLNNGKKFKQWVLLNTARGSDYLGFNLSKQIFNHKLVQEGFDYYVSDSKFVHLVINNEYKGLRLLAEQNQEAKGRVELSKNNPDGQKSSYFLEMDNYAHMDLVDAFNKNEFSSSKWNDVKAWKGKESFHFDLDYSTNLSSSYNVFKDINGVTGYLGNYKLLKDGLTINYLNDSFTIKNKIYTEEQALFISNYLKGLWNICFNAIEYGKFFKFDKDYNLIEDKSAKTAKEVCQDLVDLESLCNEIIIEELVRDNDVGAGSLYFAIDFNALENEKYNKLTFECPWDFNFAYYPISTDLDKGKYWENKYELFAGAWQSPHILVGAGMSPYERSNPWFILFTKAPWFRQMINQKLEILGEEAINKACCLVLKDLIAVSKEGGSFEKDYLKFVRNRISYLKMMYSKL